MEKTRIDRIFDPISTPQHYSIFNSKLVVYHKNQNLNQIVIDNIPTTRFYCEKKQKNIINFHLWKLNCKNNSYKLQVWPIDFELIVKKKEFEVGSCSLFAKFPDTSVLNLIDLKCFIHNTKFIVLVCSLIPKIQLNQLINLLIFQNELSFVKICQNGI